MESYEKLLLQNQAWVQEKLEHDPSYFKELSKVQTPEFLWIGCSDSRVPANEITNTSPGEVFVHRNIANMVVHTDLNMLSVLQYAVQVLKVKHVIVCGHYGCGGVKSAISHQELGLINKWLRNIKDIYHMHRDELNGIEDEDRRLARLVEINVQEQVNNLTKTSIIQRAWYETGYPYIHGWVFALEDGRLKELCMKGPDSEMDDIYRFQF